jgi:hypothetical protein
MRRQQKHIIKCSSRPIWSAIVLPFDSIYIALIWHHANIYIFYKDSIDWSAMERFVEITSKNFLAGLRPAGSKFRGKNIVWGEIGK